MKKDVCKTEMASELDRKLELILRLNLAVEFDIISSKSHNLAQKAFLSFMK